MKSRGRATAATLLLVASLAMSACSLKLPGGIIEPSIAPSSVRRGSTVVAREFPFEDSTVKINVPVDDAVYAGAQSAPKSAVLIGKVKASQWVPAYYRAFIDESHQAPFYDAALSALHEARRLKGLDDSRYVELVLALAQSLEYRTDPVDLAPKFPIETFADGFGDCDDKALLAAALLSLDGFDVSILLFEAEKHVALGVRAPGLDYQGTGYAYVEMTRPALVGTVPDGLSGGLKLVSKPNVIRIGTGTRTYAAADQVLFIEQRLAAMESAMASLRTRISAERTSLDARRTSLQADKQAAQATGDPGAVERYNRGAEQYNSSVAELDLLISRFNSLVDVEKYVADHRSARPQVYERLKALEL